MLLAAAQWLAAPWRDLGVLTLTAAGATLLLARGIPSSGAAALLVVAAALAAVAWNRGARHGVGRPGLDGVGVAVAAIAAVGPWVLPQVVPPGPRERLVELLVVLLGLTAAVGLPLALERPGPRHRRPRWFRRVPVVEHAPGARGEPTSPEGAPDRSNAGGSQTESGAA